MQEYQLSGLYVISISPLIADFLTKVESILKGGTDLFQLRAKNVPRDEIIKIGKKVLELTKSYKVTLIINDDPGIAQTIGADGVHLGWYDKSIEETRGILGSDKIIGVSTYGNVKYAEEAEKRGANYLSLGAFFPSQTKPQAKCISVSTLETTRKVSKLPIFAIGGITADKLEPLIKAGADGIAVISAVWGQEDVEQATRILKSRIYEIVRGLGE